MDREFRVHIKPSVLALYHKQIREKMSEWEKKSEMEGDKYHQNFELCRDVLWMMEQSFVSQMSFTQRQLGILGLC